MMAYESDSLPWTQVAELSYDSFMARRMIFPESRSTLFRIMR